MHLLYFEFRINPVSLNLVLLEEMTFYIRFLEQKLWGLAIVF